MTSPGVPSASERPAHTPVLLEESMKWLQLSPDGIYVDCTVGAGGHAQAIAARLSGGRLIALDRDAAAVAMASERLRGYACASVHHANYSELRTVLTSLGIGSVDGVLLDAGTSSMQLDTVERGFSFQEDGPLDMRMDSSLPHSAETFLASVRFEDLVETLKQYGDVKPAGRIARAIIEMRETGALGRTHDLVAAVQAALPFVDGIPDEVRTVFQAIRIAVNDEYGCLEAGVKAGMAALRPGGRMVVIAFHSGEDRIVKNVFRDMARPRRLLHPDGRVKEVLLPRMEVLTRKPIVPSEEEMKCNSRAKSARMRVAECINR